MIIAPEKIFDGQISWAGGMDAGRNPVLLNEDQYQFGENIVCRGGEASTRPAFKKLTLNFTNNVTYNERGNHDTTGGPHVFIGSSDAFKVGPFQCASFYDPSLEVDCLMVSIGGRLFQVVPRRTTADVTELYLDHTNHENHHIAYMVQADRFHITQDGENAPIIFDGVSARRAGAGEIFTGTFMAYGLGRIVLIGKNLRDIYFGDLYGSHDGEPGASVLQFTETTFLSEGGAASLPFTLGHAKGAIFFPEQDTTMGQGELLVFAEKGMASFFLDLPREQWKTSKFQALALIDIGATGDKTLTPVNSDIWFRSSDGWRTYRQARAEAKGWFQLPLSTEVGNYVDVETPSMLYLASSIHFNNRLIATCTPVPNQQKPYFAGLLSLDFDVLSSFGQARQPSWDGHWNGIKTTQLVTGNFDGKRRAFAFGLDDDGWNCIYEIDADQTRDSSGPITSSIVPKSFTFKEYFNEGRLNGADIWVNNVKEQTTFQMWFKPDNYPDWIPWMTATQDPKAPVSPIGVVGQIANGVPVSREGFSPRLSFIKPRPTIDPATKRDSQRFYEVHQKIEWVGNASINRLRLAQARETEKVKATR